MSFFRAAAITGETTGQGKMLRALGHRNFRLYLAGLVISLVGTYMQLVAEGWLVYRLSNSALVLGAVGFVAMLPLVALTLFAGALADRLPRQTILKFAQVGQMLPPLVLAWLTWSHQVQIWHVVATDLVLGAFSAVDQPARQALIAETTPAADLDGAIALSGVGFNVARVIGPVIAGILVAAFGEATCFAFNGLSFMAVAAALLLMKLPARQAAAARQRSMAGNLVDSARYLAREPALLSLAGLLVIVNLFVVPYQTLLPLFARDILGAGAVGLGLLTAAAGAGAIGGAFGVAGLPARRRGWLLLGLGLGAVLAIFGFASSRSLLIACLALVLASGGIVGAKVLIFTFVQGRVLDEFRGRVMSVIVLLDAGVPRMGGLGVGGLAALAGAPVAMAAAGLAGLVALFGLARLAPALRELE